MNESFITKVIEAYRITIPKKIREKLQLQEGDLVEAVVIRKIEKTNTETEKESERQ
jgi:AbrB family looped-hinge helix DNA binding protein